MKGAIKAFAILIAAAAVILGITGPHRFPSEVEAQPVTGRTHQIRVHLAATGHPVVGDPLYGTDKMTESKGRQRLALRAVKLVYRDPFQKRKIWIEAPTEEFLTEFFGTVTGI